MDAWSAAPFDEELRPEDTQGKPQEEGKGGGSAMATVRTTSPVDKHCKQGTGDIPSVGNGP